ncbi:MarR family winged helix-turn-helix transcriptional regulator [Paraburkholderia sp. HP33-1]|uniref:MarR family winged helix-turn-helix transcriptional regulator n=1 Tax=Paraburkholderia sp. HP33-1 TaxID=2883243 RepID=UPI001F2E8D9D|nr:MarR family transcriptional regulator [Paraburkholderia sp. HP33-1]
MSKGRSNVAGKARVLEDQPEPRYEPPDISFGELAQAIGFNLRLAQQASFQAFARRVGSSDLRAGFYATLVLIHENPGISQTALSQANGRDKSTLTPVLNDLERRGFVLRERLATDRRSYSLRLTTKGAKALKTLRMHALEHDKMLDELIEPAHKEEFLRSLRKIIAHLA